MPTAAFFDLDRTLLAGGSGPVFAATLERLGVSTPKIPGQAALFKFFDVFGESFVVMQLARLAAKRARGLDRAMVQASAEIAADELLGRLQPHVRPLLERHRTEGDILVLATTSPFDLVAPFARRLGLDAVVATRYAEHEGIYTGEIDGTFVWGPGKLEAIRSWATSHDVELQDCAAYSDSVFDTPMLSAVGRPVAVNPDARLRAMATARRWPIRSLDAPEGVPAFNGLEPYDVVRTLARPEFFPFAKFVFEGTENIPVGGPAIIAANHRSYFDPLAIGLAVARAGRNARFMGKKEVFEAPVFGQVARAMGAIRVDRGTGSDRPLREAAAALAGGEIVVILPQGTIPRGEAFFDPILRGRLGVARLAVMCPDVPVVPMGVWGTEQVWPRSAKVPSVWNVTEPPSVLLRSGAPVTLGRCEDSVNDDLELVMKAIMDLLPPESLEARELTAAELAATVPDGDLGKLRPSGPRPDVVTPAARALSPKGVAELKEVPAEKVAARKAGKPAAAKGTPKKATPKKVAAKKVAANGPAKKATAKKATAKKASAKPAARKPATSKVSLTAAVPRDPTRRGSLSPNAPSRRLRGTIRSRALADNR